MYAKLRNAAAANPAQQVLDLVVVAGSAAPLPGTAPVINNQSPDFASLAAVTTAYNNLLAALRTRGVIAGS
ncbi:hypothetical protein KCH_15320 [Kitasatospora cheerisanensis KCTC 2395]|uniref:Uncharacterized protein n=2 Tax=Streptomycetaceae TaxID=2062 RepID=A0A066Z9A6_9ACTN|nr:hypothetical protein KCH_15320 [Kitasatospora cheerisanensis KCTC 2395]